MKYKSLQAKTIEELNKAIEKSVSNGWVADGSTQIKRIMDFSFYAQEMTLDDDYE